MVLEGDFVPGVAGEGNPLKPETGFNVFPFPEIGDSGQPSSAAATSSSCSRTNPAAQAFIEYLTTPEASRDLGQARRVLVAEQERRLERLSGPDPADDRGRDRRGGSLPLRPVRPAAVRVRRHRRPGPLQAVPGLPEEPRPTSTGSPRRWRPRPQRRSASAMSGAEAASRGSRPSRRLPRPPEAGRLAQARAGRRLPRSRRRLPRRLDHLSGDLDDHPELLRQRPATSSSGSTTTRTCSRATRRSPRSRTTSIWLADRARADHGDRARSSPC